MANPGKLIQNAYLASPSLRIPGLLFLLLVATQSLAIMRDTTSEPLLISYRLDSEPLQFRNESGEADGIMIDLWRLWSRKSGIPVQFVGGDNMATQKMIADADADINAGLFPNERRAEFLDFSQPILKSSYYVYYDKSLNLADIADLKQFPVGVTKGSFHEDYLRKHFPATKLILFENYRALFDAAEQKALKVFVTQSLYINRYLATHGIANHYKFLKTPLYTRAYRAAVKKGRSQLLGTINLYLSQITEADRTSLNTKWLGTGWALYRPQQLILSDKERSWLDAHREIRLGIDPEWPPFEFVDKEGKYQGLSADFVALFNSMLNINMQPVSDLSWGEAMTKIRSGELDVLPAAMAIPERQRFLDFTKPYLVYPYVIFVHEDSQLVTDLDDLAYKKIAVIKSYAIEELLRQNHEKIELVTFATTTDALFALSRGDVDAFVSNLSAAAWAIDKTGISDVKIAGPTPYQFEQSIGVRKDWPELLALLNRAIDKVSPEQYQTIKNRWFKVRFEQKTDLTEILRVGLTIAGIALLVFLWMLYWNRRLQREIKRRKITEHELAATKDALIKSSQEKFRNLIEGSIQGIWIYVDWKPVFANQALVTILGYESIEEILQLSSVETCIAPYERERLWRYSDLRLKEGDAPTRYEFDAVRKDGQIISLENIVRTVEWDGKHALQSTLVDITERKQTAKSLKDSEERLSRFFSASFEGLFFHNQGAIIDVNPAVETLFGYTPGEVMGRNILEFVIPECRPLVMKNMQAGSEEPYEVTIMSKSGFHVPVEVRAKTIEIHGNTSRVVALHDVTELKQAELSLQKAHDQLEDKVIKRTRELAEANIRLTELDQLKSMFIASMSHELRTPLNAIIGFTGIILQGMSGDINAGQRDQLTRVYGAAKHLMALISDVIDISKIEAGRADVDPIIFDLKELIEEAIGNIDPALQDKGLELEVDIPENLILDTDRKRLLQCVLNLLSNAVKYTENGSISITVQDRGQDVEISVIDTGIGIEAQQLSKLFEPFERIDSSLRLQTPGAGLGLYLTRKLASELLEGEIAVVSHVGSGSTFQLTVSKSLESHVVIPASKEKVN